MLELSSVVFFQHQHQFSTHASLLSVAWHFQFTALIALPTIVTFFQSHSLRSGFSQHSVVYQARRDTMTLNLTKGRRSAPLCSESDPSYPLDLYSFSPLSPFPSLLQLCLELSSLSSNFNTCVAFLFLRLFSSINCA